MSYAFLNRSSYTVTSTALSDKETAVKKCDRCKLESYTVRWVARIGGSLCTECRKHERAS